MATTSPPKPWQTSSTGTSSTALSSTVNAGTSTATNTGALTTTASATSNANSRLRPWEREASGGRLDGEYSTASALRRPYDSNYDSQYSNTPYSASRYGSGYGSRYGGYGGSTYGSYGGYGSGYGSYGTGYGSYGMGGYGSSYGSSYGSGYGGYGSYGSGYGDYGFGGGYGGYGGGYGGAEGYGKYGPPNQGAAGFLGWRGAADQGFQWVNGFHSVTANFGRFAGLLDANSQAMHGALSSIVRLIENAGFLYREIGFALSGFTLVRLIQRLVRKMLGKAASTHSTSANGTQGALDAVNEFQKETQSSSGPTRFWITFLVAIASFAFFGIPILNRTLSRWLGPEDENKLEAAWDPRNPSSAPQMRALHDYPAQSEHELSLRQGDIITVTRKPFEAWWEGEIVGQPGRLGLFPTNYTQPLNPPADSTPTPLP